MRDGTSGKRPAVPSVAACRRLAVFVLMAMIPVAALGADAPPLGALADRLGARFTYDPLTGSGSIERQGFRIVFKTGFPYFSFGDALRSLPPIASDGGVLTVPDATGAAIESWFAEREADAKSRFRVAAILIDPGHGGKDPGAIGEHKIAGKTLRVVEKDLALLIARRVYADLKARFPDRTILLTRGDDTYPTLEDRVDMANSVDLGPREAVIYVSIHANASFNKNASGFEVWYLDPDYRRPVVDPKKTGDVDPSVLPIINVMMEEEFTTESIILARGIAFRMGSALGTLSRNRGIRAEEWFVVRNAKMPSVLVEVGFVTSPDEAKLLSDSAHLSKIGDAVYNGIVDFVDHFEHRGEGSVP